MGKRGPKPKNAKQPVEIVHKEKIKPPTDLDPVARAAWNYVVASLPAEHFRSGDLQLLRAYCQCWSDAERMSEVIKRNGIEVEDRFGQMVPNPFISERNKVLTRLESLATKLRICASTRGRGGHRSEVKTEDAAHSKSSRFLFGG
jgi:Phage terminase, small subunit